MRESFGQYVCSISVYGSITGQDHEGVSEQEPTATENLYGSAKRYVEILRDIYRQQLGVKFIALRISSVIGPGTAGSSSPWRNGQRFIAAFGYTPISLKERPLLFS